MSKSKPKSFGRRDWYDPEDNDYDDDRDSRAARERRREKKMKNLLRSKNVEQMMEMDDE